MSDALAIGAVTAVIKNLLENGLVRQGISTSLGETPAITVVSPNSEGAIGSDPAKDRLNLFLYQTTVNSGWQNRALPMRNSGGERVDNPPLALDLHYLLTAYSQEAFHAEIMLGYAMQMLHETPVLTRDTLRTILQSLTSSSQPAARALSAVNLADQMEQLKITPQSLTTEELSQLWSVMQTPYRPTAAYQVSVVLIEARRSLKSALPVRERRLFALPYRQIVLTEVQPQIVLPSSRLTVRGQNLQAEAVRVKIGNVTLEGSDESVAVRDREIQLAVPAGLRAGISTVQVVHLLDFGVPSGLHRGYESNVLPFVLRPRIVQAEASATEPKVTLTVDPVIGKDKQVTLLLNEQAADAAGYSAIAPPRSVDSRQITIPLPPVKAGRYLLRIRVDGAESLPDVDADNLFSGEPSIVTGQS